MLDYPTGSVVKSDLQQLAQEGDRSANPFGDRIFLGGSMDGDWKLAPEELVPNVDKNAAYPIAIDQLKKSELLPDDFELRQVKYLNNNIELSASVY